MNSIPSINVATSNTSFKRSCQGLVASIPDNSENAHAAIQIININFKNLFASMRELIPLVRPKYSRPTLSDTIFMNSGNGTIGMTKDGLINHKYITYCHENPTSGKTVKKSI